MNNCLTFFRCCLLSLCFTNLLYAQTTGSKNVSLALSEFALLDIEPNTNVIAFNFSPPTQAGMPISTPAVNTSKWINYTSAKATATPNRTISAQIDQLIPGITVKVQAATAIGGGGTLGTTTGLQTLNTSAQTIISGIGGAFTGNGTSNGHQLSISTQITTYTQLVQTSNQTITLTYTISN